MTAGLLLQYVLVAAAVAVAAAVVMVKQFPGVTRRLRVALALPMLAAQRPPWMRALARRIAPAPAGSGSDCGGCNGCD